MKTIVEGLGGEERYKKAVACGQERYEYYWCVREDMMGDRIEWRFRTRMADSE